MMVCGGGDGHAGEGVQHLTLELSGRGGEEFGVGGDERAKVGRLPRWSKHEILVLIEAKKRDEAKWLKVREERERGLETAKHVTSDSKWLSISLLCKRHGVMRSPAQCRKRWCNLSADYRRIWDWQSLRGNQPFWLMSNDVRKENKLPRCFDQEVFDSLDQCFGKQPCNISEIIFDSGRPGVDDSLFSEIEHPLQEEISVSPDTELMESSTPMESPPMESPMPTPGTCEEIFSVEKFVDPCEKAHVHSMGRKKRKRPPIGEESDDFKNHLVSMLESNSRVLTAHLESQNLNSQLDRTQRKEHAESLVGVLGKLADALGRVADRL